MGKIEEDKSVEFELERYKYILQQLHSLNENHHKYLPLYQTLATAVMGGGIFIFVSWKVFKLMPSPIALAFGGCLDYLLS
jgi:hypothetical protein